uniref:Uncharacterized protein n=1 Tax=Plectus sambesii TaxID=2011161 RepID=A0A914XFP6_9BILA
MRAIKREKNAPKELKKLNATLAKAVNNIDCVELVTAPSHASAVQPNYKSKFTGALGEDGTPTASGADGDVEGMQLDDKRTFNPRTMRDENGKYPVWMSQRKIKQQKTKRVAIAKGKARKQKQRR